MLNKMRNQWSLLNKWSKIGVVTATVLVFYTLIGFFLVPFTARKVALSKLPELLSRPVSIERVYFNPYTIHLEVEGVKIAKKDGDGNLFSFRLFDLDVDGFSLFKLSASFDRIHIYDPQFDVAVFRGGSSVSDLVPVDSAEADDESKDVFPFILNNLSITNGTIKFYDKVRDVRHLVDDINLSIPFTSSLSKDSERQVQPTLDMVINGTPFALEGHTLPFQSSLKTEFDFTLEKAPLSEYWVYLPIYETTELKSGMLSAKLTLAFERGSKLLPQVLIRGNAHINNFDLAARGGDSLIKFSDFDVNLDRVKILRRIFELSSVKLVDPYLKIGIKKDGTPDLLDYFKPALEAGEKSKEGETEAGPVLTAFLGEFVLENGKIDFTDNGFSNGFKKTITPISVRASKLNTSGKNPGTYNFKIGSNSTEIISGNGTLALIPLAVNGTLSVADLDIPDYHIYLDDPLPLDVASGKVGVGSSFIFEPESETVRLNNIRVNVDDLQLKPKGGGKTLVGLGGFAMTNGTVDVKEKSVIIDSINLNKALLRLMRSRNGIDLLQHIEKHQKGLSAGEKKMRDGEKKADKEVQKAAGALKEKAWQVRLNRFLLADSAVELTDKAATSTTKTTVDKIKIGLNNLTYPEKSPATVYLAAVINKRGYLDVSGQVGPQTLKGNGKVRLRKFRLRDFNGYLLPQMQMNIARGHVDVNGKWSFSAAKEPVASYKGKVQLKDLLVRDTQGNKKFFHLNEFSVRGIDFVSAPFKVKAESVGVVEPQVFLEREEDGTINISRMLTGKRAEPVNATAVDEQAEKVAEKSKVAGVSGKETLTEDQTAEPVDKSENNIFVAKMFMSNGTVIFKDLSVSPAFELDITKMRSAVHGLELPYGERIDLSFNATLDQQAPLVAEGFLQPTDEGTNTDLRISLANLDMTQLSPYTEKFIAYPVSTGMLSSDVGVKLRGKYLAVENIFDIYQFDVGEKVDNPDAPSIPIGLGLALLRDSDGNIRLDIPVDGDLSDPQFRLGRVIGRAIVNLLVKAVTSPFALIGALVGGSEDMDVLAFEAGRSALKEDEISKVESIVKAMKDRPGLNLEISGFAAPEDIPALEKAEFKRQVAMPKFLDMEGDENAPDSVDAVVVSAEEYPEYLEDAYKEAPFDKPKNFLGFVESQPVPVMEKALRDHIKISDTQMAELARDRAEKIRELLADKSGIAPERIFLKGMSATGKGSGPRVELGLK